MNAPPFLANSLQPAEFRNALGMFATGVTIVTASLSDNIPGRPPHLVGLTANSFNSVSLQPPLVLWSLARTAGSVPIFTAGSHYAINILAADQRHLAERFAARIHQRFEGVDWQPGLGGAPILQGAVAVFECANKSRYEEGDHIIFVGHVQRCICRSGASPLIFHGGRFYTELPLK
jgi:flavin reductase (DIM6/NTAB) family NADH-FMN oxidoreductase RutF